MRLRLDLINFLIRRELLFNSLLKSKIMKYIYLFLIYVVLLTACNSTSIEVERISLQPKMVYDSIETRMPGQLIMSPKYIIWTDPFSSENQVHIIDRNSCKEMGQFINIGNGPEEFVTPFYASSSNNELVVFDMNKDKVAIFSIDSICNQTKSLISTISQKTIGATRIVEVGHKDYILFNTNEKLPFLSSKGYAFGKFPFDENVSNNNNVSQGNICYNSSNNYLIYSTILFPYMAAYEKRGDRYELIWEKKEETDYSILDNNAIIDKKKRGSAELALTKNYIVTLQRDYQNDPMDESTVGRDFTKIPKTLFLYDYKSNLRKIVHLNMPIIRIASEIESDVIYAIGLNPDFTLIKCDLSDI